VRDIARGRIARSPFAFLVIQIDDAFALPFVPHPGDGVAIAQERRERQPDQRGGEMRLPRVPGPDRQHAPDRVTVEERDRQRGGDRAAVAANQSAANT
jgi:hypothetical protein